MTVRIHLLAIAPLLAALLATPPAQADIAPGPPPPAPSQPDPGAPQPQSAPPPPTVAPSSAGRKAGGCALGTGPAEEGAVGASLLLLAVGLAVRARRTGRR